MKYIVLSAFASVLLASSGFADQHPPKPVAPSGDGPHLQAHGEIETVLDWSTQSCGPAHFADLPARAFRDDQNQVQMIISHHFNRRMIGPELSQLAVECDLIMGSTQKPDPEFYAFREWIAAPYTIDGKQIHALVHNEFQGNSINRIICPSGNIFNCWYNAITYVQSNDSGASYAHIQNPPEHLVATIPHTYVADAGVIGAFAPSNIIAHDGYFYAYFKAQLPPDGVQRTCLMRTDDLGDPKAWRFWTILGFEGEFIDPYRQPEASVFRATCDPIDINNIAEIYESITWNTALEKFVLVGTSNDPSRADNYHGFYYALSDDLINWERRKPLLEARLPWRVSDPHIPVYLYPALLDPDSESRNFETTDGSMYLYFTRLNEGQSGLDRDLVRMRVDVVK